MKVNEKDIASHKNVVLVNYVRSSIHAFETGRVTDFIKRDDVAYVCPIIIRGERVRTNNGRLL